MVLQSSCEPPPSPSLSLSLSVVSLLLCVRVCLLALQGRDPPGIPALSWTHLTQSAPVDHLAISCLLLKLGPDLQSLPWCCLTAVVFTLPLCFSLFAEAF